MSSSSSNTSTEALIQHLHTLLPSDSRQSLRTSVLPALIDCIGSIATALRNSQRVSLAGSANAFGDDQLNVDVVAEDVVRAAVAACPSVFTASSEEDPIERPARDGADEQSHPGADRGEEYTVAFDPLDGSSIIAPNWAVGTILGVWDGRTALSSPPAEAQIASVLGVYGPRTTAIVALRIPGAASACFEVGLGEKGWEIIRPEVRLAQPPFKTRYFAPANLRAAAEDERYMTLVTRFMKDKYTLRYSGGLVPDVVHALVKGHGLYVSPVTAASKAKLRRLYELYPVALVVECAGGKAVDPVDGRRILDMALENTDERAGLVCGTPGEVDDVMKALLD
ncbi:Fructose-bisphosphatase [Pleurostoma richardsiae]|uniref:Fructose-bisphosphatase n=1 Tax=Pleurostoma richardsiae TaxID=41990 RepID=A0AA38RR96_9PEZI|nr:Fructose-bisphosphatase [Pleurostoma richardsiae]